jgi:uncharacterized protein (DUF58 family)
MQLRSPLIPLLAGAALTMQILDPTVIWATLLVGLCVLWLACYGYARLLAKNLTLSREVRFGWAQVGDALEERFTLKNSGPVSAAWVEIRDHSTLPGQAATQVRAVDGHSSTTWRRRIICSRRGVYRLGPTTLHSGDPFGIYTVEITSPASTTLFVMPPVIPLPEIQIAPGGRPGEGKPSRSTFDKTISASSVREFVPGDSLHWMHWKTTARRDEPYVRVFDGIPAGDWWIVLDLNQAVHSGQGSQSTLEQAVILAASLADAGIRQRRAVGLAACGESLVWLPPQAGENRRWEILRALAPVQPGDQPLEKLLERSLPSRGFPPSLVIITPANHTAWIPKLLPHQRRGAPVTVLLLEPGEPVPAGEARWAAAGLLARQGVHCCSIPAQTFDLPEARPGQDGDWGWKVTPRGRAISVGPAAAAPWKTLS